MNKQLFIILFSVITLTSCNKNVLVDNFHDIPEEGWQYQNVVIDSFEVTNPHLYHQYYVNLRINGDYAYSNIHVKLTTISPDSSTKEEIIPILLAEKSGRWLGSGLGDVLTFQVPVMGKQEFKQKGKYTVKLEQYMRLEFLPNIVSAGMKIEQQEEIF